jgi:hypothetical protein
MRDEEFRSIHKNVCYAIERGADDGPAMAAVRRGMRALAAQIPIKRKTRTVARRRGKLPDSVERPPPLLWQMIDMARFRRIAGSYKGWALPSNRPFGECYGFCVRGFRDRLVSSRINVLRLESDLRTG